MVMGEETRLERQLDKWVARATRPRGAAIVIATVTTVMTVGTGLLMTVVDHDNFPSLGGGLWWAIQTVTTVGYGDAVPETTAGRLLAALVMLLGIGFLTVITAAITSTFVAQAGGRLKAGSGDPSAEQLTRIDERLERIEAALRELR
jgi:voltage-gated potassium channel